MSVIKFSKKEIDSLGANVLANLETYKYIFLNSKQVMHDCLYYKDKQERAIENCIGRLFWYLHVANATVYGLQYREPIELDNEDYPMSKRLELPELLRKLKSLDYNLSSNDGNRFIHRAWEDLFFDIINVTADKLAYRIIDNQ